MKKSLRFLGVLALLCASTTAAAQQEFLFGVWLNNLPGIECNSNSWFYTMLSETLHFNTVVGTCYTDIDLAGYRSHGIGVINANGYQDSAGISSTACGDSIKSSPWWPRLYGEAAYQVWELENGNTTGRPCNFWYDGTAGSAGSQAGTAFVFFDHTRVPLRVPRQVVIGPSREGWCCGQSIYIGPGNSGGRREYRMQIRFKLGPKLPGSSSVDTVASFDIQADNCWDNTTLVQYIKNPYILGSSLSQDTVFHWSDTLVYSFNQSAHICDEANVVYTMNFKMTWNSNRDIYIDKLKLYDQYGRDLWEDTLAEHRIKGFVDRYYGQSEVTKGWYLIDDQDLLLCQRLCRVNEAC